MSCRLYGFRSNFDSCMREDCNLGCLDDRLAQILFRFMHARGLQPLRVYVVSLAQIISIHACARIATLIYAIAK